MHPALWYQKGILHYLEPQVVDSNLPVTWNLFSSRTVIINTRTMTDIMHSHAQHNQRPIDYHL